MTETLPGAMGAEEDGEVIGFMCLTDWECEIGLAMGGNAVFPSIGDIKRSRKCVESCGIVEVRVRAVRVVQPANQPWGDE